MKINKTRLILQSVLNGASDFMAVFLAAASAPYGSSVSKIEKRVDEILDESHFNDSVLIKEKRKLRCLISKLKKEGLLESTSGKIIITNSGHKKLEKISNSPFPEYSYQKSPGKSLKIIAFDIPEKDRRKRGWIRGVLTSLGFVMLQKSVWYGKIDIPERFLKDLKFMNILEYVDILAVTKTGTLEEI